MKLDETGLVANLVDAVAEWTGFRQETISKDESEEASLDDEDESTDCLYDVEPEETDVPEEVEEPGSTECESCCEMSEQPDLGDSGGIVDAIAIDIGAIDLNPAEIEANFEHVRSEIREHQGISRQRRLRSLERPNIDVTERTSYLAMSHGGGVTELRPPKMGLAKVLPETRPSSRAECARRCGSDGFCDPSSELGCGGEYCGWKYGEV